MAAIELLLISTMVEIKGYTGYILKIATLSLLSAS